MPPGSSLKALSAAFRRPSTSTMSRDGAPRANEIGFAMDLRLRIRLVELHLDDRPIRPLVTPDGHLADARQARYGLLELAQGLEARERAGGQGHVRGVEP